MVLCWGALNAARKQEGENSKQQYSAACRCQGPLAGRGLMVTDFLGDLNHEARCFLGKLETGMSKQSDKAKGKSRDWHKKPAEEDRIGAWHWKWEQGIN